MQVKTATMDLRDNDEMARLVNGALDWWREAGVDCLFVDTPEPWLAGEAPRPAPQGAPQAHPDGAPARQAPVEAGPAEPAKLESLPDTLAAFHEWWLETPLFDVFGLGERIAPQGKSDAALMILVEAPEAGDGDALLSGPQGKLLDAMLRAFGLSRQEAYLASVLPCPVPAPDWEDLRLRGMGQIIARHIALAAPQRLIVMGGNILPLIGHELPQYSAVLRKFNQEGKTIPMLAAWGLPVLPRHPRRKAALWRAWLEWTRV